MNFLQRIPVLQVTDEAADVATAVLSSGVIPKRATQDALHIAIASTHDADFLLTWNCRHIANAAIMKELNEIVTRCGFCLPVLCTPEELMGDLSNVD